MKKLKFMICMAALVVLTTQTVLAEPIEVLNPSFEYSGAVDIDVKTMGVCPDDWTYGPSDPTCIGLEGTGTTGVEGEPEDDYVCAAVISFGSEGSIYQLTDYTIGAGDEYTLTFDAFYLWASGAPWDCTFQGRLYYDDAGARTVIDYVEDTLDDVEDGEPDWVWHPDYELITTVPPGHAAIGNKLGIELAATMGGGWFGFDTVALDVQTATKATNVHPPDEAENISPDVVLEWAAPLLYTPIYYDVYFSTDPNADKDSYRVLTNANQLTYDDPCTLDYDTEYFWRVVSYETYDVNYPGGVWSFTTWPPTPIFTTDAQHTLVTEGDSAEFSVISPNATLGFQWYREPSTAVNHGDDGGDVSVVSDATSSTLTIDNVNKAADEDFYYCVTTNNNGSAESTHAKLEVADLLAHWTMDSSKFVANQYVDETGDHNADPNKPSAVSFTTGIIGGALGAVEMDGFRWARAGNWRPNAYSGQMTVSAWIKVPDTNDIDGDGQGIVSKREGDSFDWALYVRGGDGGHPDDNYVRFTSWNGGDAWASLDPVMDPDDPDWVFVVATVDGAGAGRLYINGSEQAVDDEWVFGTNEDADILIGKGTPTDYVFPGVIDDVKIRNYAQDGYEIATDYTDVAGGSVCVEDIPGDYTGDCQVNLADVAELALIWQNCNIIPASACP